jgi:hypothetical protein
LGTWINTGKSYWLGQVENPVAAWNAELNSRYTNNAVQSVLQTIQGEVILQLQAYLDAQAA